MDQMENILSRLTIPVAIMDKDPETWSATEQLPLEQISDGMIQSVRGVLYLGITQPAVVLSCEERLPGARDVLTLAETLVATLAGGGGRVRMPLTFIAAPARGINRRRAGSTGS